MSQWTSSFSLIGPTGATGPAGTFGLLGSTGGDYIYYDGTTWTVGSTIISIGSGAGQISQGAFSLAVGNLAGSSNQGANSVALGNSAGNFNQSFNAVAIGYLAGNIHQSSYGIAIGYSAGCNAQSSYSIAIGASAGLDFQSDNSIAIGPDAGNTNQNANSVAIGYQAGYNTQGSHAVAIGFQAGDLNQPSESILLNAGPTGLNAENAGLYIKPIREVGATGQYGLFYDTATHEVIHNSVITISSISSIVVGANIIPDRTLAYSLGTSSLRFTDAFFGPGTINIAGPSNANATIGTDAQGTIYTESGFATPFINIGPVQLTPQAVGGWQIGPTGTQGATGYDLIVQEQQANGSGPTGPAYSLIHPVATAKGYIITVDDVYGDDSLGTPGLYPYKTINAAVTALSVVGALNTIVVNPGNYTLTSPITLPANTSIRGISLQTCKITYSTTVDTTMITMGENTRIEDLSLTLTSASDVELVGIGFPGETAQTAKVRTSVITVDNRDATTAKTVSAVLFDGANVASTSDFSFNALKGCTVNVYSNSSGRVRGLLCTESAIMSTRDLNIYVSSFTAQMDYIGVETLSTSIALLRTSAVSGTTADISQTAGTLQIGPGTDLINRTANGKTFSTSVYPTTIFYGLKGDLSNMTSTDGWLWPGTLGIVKATGGAPAYPDTSIAYYRVQQPAILYGMTADVGNPASASHSTIFMAFVSTSAYSTATPTTFTIGYVDDETGTKTNFSKSVSLKTGDRIALYLSTTGSLNTNTMHDMTLQLDLF